MDTDNMTAQQFADALNERRAAELKIIEAAREVWRSCEVQRRVGGFVVSTESMKGLVAALAALDALDAPAPDDTQRAEVESCGSRYGSCVVVREGDTLHCQTCDKRTARTSTAQD